MNLVQERDDINAYLEASEIIDYEDSNISDLVNQLSFGTDDEVELARKAYLFVRDQISHSLDIGGQIVTCKASEVLEHKQGICYAKSHLLAAILRKLGIPTGFCYQILLLNDEDQPWPVLHGLNAIYLKKFGKWVRVDARGNKQGVNAEFSVYDERLAFCVRKELGEAEDPTIFSVPNPNIIRALRESKLVSELINNLPSGI
ncbi:MAG TPA: transglutaminase-like domain-containing protein [Desulfobacteria bacterium]|nr:transglutaminase-like domain-containing protein [Desulfobacteria bacterium]